MLEAAGLTVTATPLTTTHGLHVTAQTVERWVAPRAGSYLSRLTAHLDAAEVDGVKAALTAAIGRTLAWQSQAVVLHGTR